MSQEGKYLDAFGKALYDTIFLIADNINYLKSMCWYLLCNSSCQGFVCRVKYNNGEVGKVAQELYAALTSIQMGHAEDKMGWIVQLN
jgi:hypothetical protein